ncbi:hypothetical protein [Candidatus Spongiihabitans sp.]|uniref:hypothetical protein n=1 Tax=Candidatus Spongiihabitans sp. TaxID=3101308 RepID=UPI003C6F0E9F
MITEEEVYRRLQAEAMVWQDGVVIEQSIGQFAVKAFYSISDVLMLHGSPSASECNMFLNLYTLSER